MIIEDIRDIKGVSTVVRRYKLLDHIASGGFGKVYSAIQLNITTGETMSCGPCAIKAIHKTTLKRKLVRNLIKNEIITMRDMDHPFLCTFLTYFESNTHVYIVMTLYSTHSLRDTIRKHGPLTEAAAFRYISHLITAVDYLHQHGIIHGDIKPSNLVTNDKDQLVLIDFGFACKSETDSRGHGSPSYIAPERVNKEVCTNKVDIWAIGVVFYVFVVGRTPFGSNVQGTLYSRIISLDYSIPGYLSHRAIMFLSSILRVDPKDRPSITQLKDLYVVTEEGYGRRLAGL